MAVLAGKAVLVTGASRGIGRSIALRFAREGARLLLTARNATLLDEVAQLCRGAGAEAVPTVADLGQEDQILAVFAQARDVFGRLDLLVNNAGAFDGGPLDQLPADAWDRVITVNLRAPFLCTREALKIMKPQGSGRIINVASIASQRVRPFSAPYAASKHGLWGLSQVTALEGRDYGVTCCCLNPGNVLVERRKTALPEDAEPMITGDDVAEVALLMAALPPDVEMLEATVLPHRQHFVGRG